MKVLILTSCLLAVALADYAHHYAHHYPQHIPVIGHTGVPLESPEIVHARKAHLAHVAAVKSHHGHGGYYGGEGADYYGAGAYRYGGHGHAHAHGGYHIPIIGHNGVPHDTPEVAHAKAAHFAAHAKAAAAAAASGGDHYGHHGHYRKRRGIHGGAYSYANQVHGHHIPVIGHNGVPHDTPEVAHAKAAHFAAHAQASHGHHGFGGLHAPIASLGYAHGYPIHSYPALAHDGQPLETPEVVALKTAHFAAHAEANSRIGSHGGYGYGGDYASAGFGHYGGHHGIHIPVIGHNGVPHDTPEVAHAKAAHFAAHAEASSRAHGHHYY